MTVVGLKKDLAEIAAVGTNTVIICWSWKPPPRSFFITSLLLHVTSENAPIMMNTRTYCWLCFFFLNHHRLLWMVGKVFLPPPICQLVLFSCTEAWKLSSKIVTTRASNDNLCFFRGRELPSFLWLISFTSHLYTHNTYPLLKSFSNACMPYVQHYLEWDGWRSKSLFAFPRVTEIWVSSCPKHVAGAGYNKEEVLVYNTI